MGEFKVWENVQVTAEQGSVRSDCRYWESMGVLGDLGSV